MMTHTTNISAVKNELGDRIGDDKFYYAYMALQSQGSMASCEELLDEETLSKWRRSAVREWSGAVKNGFVCC